MSGVSTTKKRKANDGQITASGDDTHDVQTDGDGCDKKSPPTQSCYGNLSQQMDTMMQIMIRMEEKCNRLEAKCNSLENRLTEHVDLLHTKIDGTVKEQVDSLDTKIDKKFKQHEYNDMLVRNQNWKTPNPEAYQPHEWMDIGFDHDTARFLSRTSMYLQYKTELMRRGKFPNENDNKMKGISLNYDEDDRIFYDGNPIIFGDTVIDHLLPHWREFAAALKQFTPAFGVLPDGCQSFFKLRNVQLNVKAIRLLKDALMNKPFHELCVVYTMDYTVRDDNHGQQDNYRREVIVNAIIALVQSNKHLRKLNMAGNLVQRWQIRELCSSVCNHSSLLDLNLRNCFDNGVADEMMTSLLTNGDIRLERLELSANNITSNVTALLSDFLATDPPLKELDLGENGLDDNDVALIANALRSNKSLRSLDLVGNSITNVGGESFRLVLNGDSTLNSVSDSNHSCHIHLELEKCDSWRNMNFLYHGQDLGIAREMNRARKIYKLLSSRHKSTSNVQHFGDIDVKVLPHMVEAVQKYASRQLNPDAEEDAETEADYNVAAVSIVYEIMRKWDKVFPLYCDPK